MATPTKYNSINCFVCFNQNSINYKLSGKKLREENFGVKLNAFLEDNIYKKLILIDEAAICRNCNNTVNKFYDFYVKLRHSTETFVAKGSLSSKRCALSPLTPKSNTGNESIHRPTQKSSRKQLKLLQDKENIQPISDVSVSEQFTSSEEIISTSLKTCLKSTLISPNISMCMLEHEYAKPTVFKQSNVNSEVLDVISHAYGRSIEQDRSVILEEVKAQSASLTSRTTLLSSVLYKYRDINKLTDNADQLLQDIVREMRERVPFLLDVLCCVAIPASGNITPGIIPVLASCYAILMKHKFHNLSAYHRLTTIIATKGGLDDRGQTRLNQMGLVLSSERRLKLQDSAQENSMKLIIENLKSQPLIKITGDNLDVYVRTSHLSKERRNKDLHLFTSNVMFCRVAKTDMNNDTPKPDVSKLSANDVLLGHNHLEIDKMKNVYAILLGRILCCLPSFLSFKHHFPQHIPHEYAEKMAAKSKVFPLPIQFKNESKHEDCLSIMDTYEDQLEKIHMGAFGNVDLLRKFRVVVGGDQLTRIRLQEAKNLRALSVTPEKRFDDLHPIVCEMWHTKQDFLEKCYKSLYKAENTPGTLYYFKTILHRTNVNGKVKGSFQPHYDLLMAVGEGLIREQFLQFFEMENEKSKPKHPLLLGYEDKTDEEKKELIFKIIIEFINKYGYGMVDTPENKSDKPQKIHKYRAVRLDGKLVLQSVIEPVPLVEDDEVYNYSLKLCHWFLQLLELSDTAKEGDMNRLLLNCKYNLPFFYSHSKLSKYLVENIDFVLKCEHLLSPLQKTRVLEGAFVNTHGGKGKNVESDLVQEHSVCNQKSLIKTLGANKSELAISRVTGSADTFAGICSNFDDTVKLKSKSARHSKPISDKDEAVIDKQLRKIRPFCFSPGRKLKGFSNVNSMPLKTTQIPELKQRINQIISRLTRGLTVAVDAEDPETAECEE